MRPFLFLLFISALVFSCSDDASDPVRTAPKLKSVTNFIQNQSGEFRPTGKLEYHYGSGQKPSSSVLSQYDIMDKTYSVFSTTEYRYSDNRLTKMEESMVGQSDKKVTTYEYANDQVSKIKEDTPAGVDTEATIHYLPGNQVEITYNHSNGRWFIYKFTLINGNKKFEQVIGDDHQLSSEVNHEFDSGKNPLTLLGYTDLFFNTISVNNKIKTETNIITAPYPQSTPVSYSYEYNESGYPTQQITTYQSLGQSATTSLVKVVYEYE